MKVQLGVGRSARRFAACALFLLLGSFAVQGAVIFPKVTNVNNSGDGSLRAAIQAANTNGADGAIVSFQIGSGCGPHVIHLDSQLPDPQYEIHFEGYSQPGSSANTMDIYAGNNAVICIILAGDNIVTDGLAVQSSVADSMTLSVQGIAFSGFTHSALNLRGGSGHLVAGIRTGGTVGGFQMDPDGYGVILAPGVHDATIGTSDNSDFNQFGDITNNAIYISSSTGSSAASHGHDIEGNKIGFVYEGATKVPLPTGGAGIAIGGYNNFLFQDDIQNAGASGIHISNVDAHENTIVLGGTENNDDNGILIDDDAHDNDIDNLEIYGNHGAGIRIVNGQGNKLEYNLISNNDGLGIDLADEGVTLNDNDSIQPTADYANRGLNFPVITAAAGGHYSGTISGTLTTTPGNYQLDFFLATPCDPSGYGQGFDRLDYRNSVTGTVNVPNLTVNGQGVTSFALPVSFFFYDGGPLSITGTTTDADGNTSEFSACLPYTDDTIFFANFEVPAT
jgi:parallel beta-helix repeat protein